MLNLIQGTVLTKIVSVKLWVRYIKFVTQVEKNMKIAYVLVTVE